MKIKRILGFSILALAATTVAVSGLNKTNDNNVETKKEAAPQDYYQGVDESSGQALQASLTSIISAGTKDIGYNGLWNAYKTTDVKPGTNIIWDMYSNIEYDADNDHGGNYSKEGDMFNREHSVPQSWFNENAPMKSDLFHVYPTDGYVNNRRGSYVFGEVGSATYTSGNGSKLGSSSFSGYNGTVFEPIDEYKGDFARTYFYMATRYSSKVGSWTKGEAQKVFKGSYPYLTTYAVNLFTKWSSEDPVSTKEINRNDAVYAIQKNRNPYIDHPEYINAVFPSEYTTAPSVDQAKINETISLINALPATITLNDEAKVNAAEASYNSLTSAEKNQVINYDKLSSAIIELKKLKGEELPKNTVKFDANGGAFKSSFNSTQEVEVGSKITLPTSDALTNTLYNHTVLTGWSDGNKTYNPGDEVLISGNTSFKAVYEAPEYISVSAALEIARITGTTNTSLKFTVRGIVTEIIEDSAQYKNITFKIKDLDSDETIEIFRAKRGDDIAVGDSIDVTGFIINYKGNKLEMNSGGTYVVSPAPQVDVYRFNVSYKSSIGIDYTTNKILNCRGNYQVLFSDFYETHSYKLLVIEGNHTEEEILAAYNGQITIDAYLANLDLEYDVVDISSASTIGSISYNSSSYATSTLIVVSERTNGIEFSNTYTLDFAKSVSKYIAANSLNANLTALLNKWLEN